MHSTLACLALLSVALCSVALAADKYDYIVVGTGPGGAPVARRLAEAGKKVLVLERGANISDLDNVYLRPPRYYDGSIYNDWFVKRYTQERYPNINQNQPYTTQSGGAYGGSTTVNGQIAIRGDRKSYDEWATEFGLLNWGYFGLLPYLIKTENNSRYNASNPSQRFSNEGPVPIITEIETGDYNNLYLQSVAASPIHSLGSNPFISSASDIRGAGWVDKTMSSKRARTFASENYIDPVLDLDITVYTNAIVTKLISSQSGSSVKGVIVLIEGETQEFKLKNDGEVILAAGPFETPKILMLSGYGPLDQLHAHGIPVKKEVDGVGKNFQDHPGFAFVNLGNVTEPQNTISYPPPQALVDEWKVNASGLLARSSDPITAFYSSGINGDEVDVQISFAESVPLPLLPYPNAFLILCYNVKPKSRGRLTLRNANPISDPVIEMGYLSNDTDIKVLVECVKYAHQLSTDKQNSPLAQFVVGNILPGLPENLWQLPPNILDPILEQVIHIAMQQGYHFGGSVSMGSVLTEDLTIQGVSGLRVVGVAAQPKVVGFNPQMSVYGMSEKLADLIKKDSWYKHRNSRYPNSLTISSLCGGRWSVSNPNNKEAVFDWKAKDPLTNQPLYQGAFSVPANSNVIIYTDEEPIQVQVSVYLYGNLQATANNAAC